MKRSGQQKYWHLLSLSIHKPLKKNSCRWIRWKGALNPSPWYCALWKTMGAICRVLPNSNAFSRSEHISAKPVSELLVQDQRIYIYIINLMLNLTVATNLLWTLLRITLFSKDSEKVTEKNIFIVTVPSSFRQGFFDPTKCGVWTSLWNIGALLYIVLQSKFPEFNITLNDLWHRGNAKMYAGMSHLLTFS